ncbi:hypothetical protein VT569_05120 [Flavobacterium psychrophilum]|uniref:hypothetical protein n=1 Tax=Flavobacterium psychrophilum TaxID=96345 RepID=UPI003B42FC93
MENKEYYYLDGANKKGPYSKQEIIDLGLSSDTLIFVDELNKWVPYQDLEDFKPKIEEIEVESNQVQNKKKLNITNFLVLLFLILSASGIAYFLTEEHKKRDFQKLEERVNDIFAGKDEICDYTKSGVKGELKKPSDFFLSSKKDNEDNELYEYYSCESGGWTVYTLKKLNYGYDLIESSSTNMGFKVPESTYRAGTDFGYGYSTPGYSIPTYRGSVQNAYNEAMEYISVEKEDKSYVAGSYNRIITFDELYSDLHYIDNIHPTKYTSASVNSKSWENLGEAYVFNKNWIVWYKQSGKHYEIVLDKDEYLKKLLVNLGIGIVTAILAFLLWKYSLKNRINIKPNA